MLDSNNAFVRLLGGIGSVLLFTLIGLVGTYAFIGIRASVSGLPIGSPNLANHKLIFDIALYGTAVGCALVMLAVMLSEAIGRRVLMWLSILALFGLASHYGLVNLHDGVARPTAAAVSGAFDAFRRSLFQILIFCAIVWFVIWVFRRALFSASVGDVLLKVGNPSGALAAYLEQLAATPARKDFKRLTIVEGIKTAGDHLALRHNLNEALHAYTEVLKNCPKTAKGRIRTRDWNTVRIGSMVGAADALLQMQQQHVAFEVYRQCVSEFDTHVLSRKVSPKLAPAILRVRKLLATA